MNTHMNLKFSTTELTAIRIKDLGSNDYPFTQFQFTQDVQDPDIPKEEVGLIIPVYDSMWPKGTYWFLYRERPKELYYAADTWLHADGSVLETIQIKPKPLHRHSKVLLDNTIKFIDEYLEEFND